MAKDKYKKLPEDPLSTDMQRQQSRNYLGLSPGRHGIWGNPSVPVNWDEISEPMTNLSYDMMMGGGITNLSLPGVLEGKWWHGASGTELAPSLSFRVSPSTGFYYRPPTSNSICLTIDGENKVCWDTDNQQMVDDYDLFWSSSTGGGIGRTDGAQCPSRVYAGLTGVDTSGELRWGSTVSPLAWAQHSRLIHTNATQRTYTFQDASGTMYQTGGLDVAIADGGTNASTQTEGFDNLAPTTTEGDLIIHDGSDNVRLGIGASNQHLISNGTTATWGDYAPPESPIKLSYKLLDQTYTNVHPVFVNDNHLVLENLVAGQHYCGKLIVWYKDDTVVTPQCIYTITADSSAVSLAYCAFGVTSAFGSMVVSGGTLGLDSTFKLYDETGTGFVNLAISNQFHGVPNTGTVTEFHFSFQLLDASANGDIEFAFAISGDPSPSARIMAGSYVEYRKVT